MRTLRIILTDHVYDRRDLDRLAKLRLGCVFGLPRKDPSVRQLTATLGVRPARLRGANTALAEKGVARFRKPKPGERVPGLADTKQATILEWSHPTADPQRESFQIQHPPALTAAIAEGFRGSPNRLAALDYLILCQRDQLKRGAFEHPADFLAWKLGLPLTTARELPRRLASLGAFRSHGTGEVADVFTFDPAATIYQANTADFDSERTRRFLALRVGHRDLILYAHPAELDRISARVRDLGDREALRTIEAAVEWHAAKATAKPILAALERAVGEHDRAAGKRNPRCRETQSASQGNDISLEAMKPSSSSTAADEARREHPRSPHERRGNEGKKSLGITRRSWDDAYPNLYTWADDQTFDAIEEIRLALERRYTVSEAAGLFREPCLAARGSGRRFLKLLHARFPDLEARQAEPCTLSDLIGGFQRVTD